MQPSHPMYVTLLSDVEDIITPEADDITRAVAELVEREGARPGTEANTARPGGARPGTEANTARPGGAHATFCVVGERVRQWRERGRTDVIKALGRHDVGYHTMLHSVHPTILEYLADKGWEDGVEAVLAREGSGVTAVQAAFGQPVSCYGGPGNSWGPQVNEAMGKLGVPAVVYAYTRVPRGDVHRFCGRICYPNGYNMQDGDYHVTPNWEADMGRLMAFISHARETGTQWVEVYLGHPSRILHEEFWDGPNFTAGEMPPRSRWTAPRRKSDADLARALENLGETVRGIAAAPGVELRTIREMNALFDAAREEELSAAEIAEVAPVIEANLTRMAAWVINPPQLDISRVRSLTRERLSTLRRLTLG